LLISGQPQQDLCKLYGFLKAVEISFQKKKNSNLVYQLFSAQLASFFLMSRHCKWCDHILLEHLISFRTFNFYKKIAATISRNETRSMNHQ